MFCFLAFRRLAPLAQTTWVQPLQQFSAHSALVVFTEKAFSLAFFNIWFLRRKGAAVYPNRLRMSGRLIKEKNLLEIEFATLDPFIDRWSATAQALSFYIKMEKGDKGTRAVIDVPTGECRGATQ